MPLRVPDPPITPLVHFLPNQQEDQAGAEGASKRQHCEQKCLREGEKRRAVLAAASKEGLGLSLPEIKTETGGWAGWKELLLSATLLEHG